MEIFRFKPLLVQTIWGGNKIVKFKGSDEKIENVGESWEISGVENSQTVVADGDRAGMPINKLVELMGSRLVGKANYERFGNQFPLLIKFIDAKTDLSIQVHPNDEIAHRHGRPMGKTEMWYIMDSDESAHIRVGLSKEITPTEYEQMVADDTITDAICLYNVKEGDCFHIPSGRIHAICGGTFLAEIQQTSDATYRIYDYNRRDKDGNLRQLHTKEASEAIDYTVENDYHTNYRPKKNEAVELVSCPFFTTTLYDVTSQTEHDFSQLDSFIILIGLKGKGEIVADDGTTTQIKGGETILLPATIGHLTIKGNIKLLETHI